MIAVSLEKRKDDSTSLKRIISDDLPIALLFLKKTPLALPSSSTFK